MFPQLMLPQRISYRRPLLAMGLVLLALIVVACATPQAPVATPTSVPALESTVAPTEQPRAQPEPQATGVGLAQSAEAGAVTVEVMPLKLDDPAAQTLDFQVTMDTHTVELGVDLAKMAALQVAGKEVAATNWQTPSTGGHHVEGVLSFPVTVDGQPTLEGATSFSLLIRNLADVPERTFTWDVAQIKAAQQGMTTTGESNPMGAGPAMTGTMPMSGTMPMGGNMAGLMQTPEVSEEAAAAPPASGVQGSVWTANEASDSISVIDAGTNQVLTTLTGIPGPHNLQAAPDGKSVWAVSGHGAAAVMIDTASFEVHGVVPTGKAPAHIVVTPDGKTAYASNSGDDTVTAIDTATMQAVATIPVGQYPHGLRPSPDGKWIYVANMEGNTLSVIDTKNNTKIADIAVGQRPVQVGFSPDGKSVYVSLNAENAVGKVDVASRRLARQGSDRRWTGPGLRDTGW